jgi:predicted Zn-dependent peptidase
MIRRLLAMAAAASLAVSPVLAQAQQDFPPMPPAGMPKPFALPAAETYALPNGMQVTLLRYGSIPKAAVGLRVLAGNLNQGENIWLPVLAGQMMREGAAGKSAADIARLAAGMGGELGIGSGNHETSVGIQVLQEHAAKAVQLVADVARRPDFPASELPRVLAGLQRNLAVAKTQPGTAADVALARAYYGPDHPYGQPIPTDAQLAAYTIDDLRRFHAENFGARRAQLYVAGQFDPAEVKAAIAEAFGDWQRGPERLSLPATPQPGPKVLLVDRPGAPQSTIRIAFPAPLIGSESDLPFRVTNALLGGAFNSRITQNIREQKGYTYSPGSSIGYNPREARWTFNADVTTAVTGPALKEVIGEIRRLQTEPPTPAEATGMRTYLAGIFVLQNASANGLINSLANRDFHGLPANWLDNFVPGVLATTPEQMQSLATQWLPLDKATIVVVGDLATVEPQLREMPELAGVPMQRVDPFATS